MPDRNWSDERQRQYRPIRRSALLIAATVALTVACGPTALSADPLSPTAAQEALFNLACSKLAGTFAANLEEAHRTEIPGWVRVCSAHPRRSECLDAATVIRWQGKTSPLNCGPGIKMSSDIAASFLPSFDHACANVTAAWLSGKETQHQMDVTTWVKTCNGHPDVSVCKAADNLIDENRKARPLTCEPSGG